MSMILLMNGAHDGDGVVASRIGADDEFSNLFHTLHRSRGRDQSADSQHEPDHCRLRGFHCV